MGRRATLRPWWSSGSIGGSSPLTGTPVAFVQRDEHTPRYAEVEHSIRAGGSKNTRPLRRGGTTWVVGSTPTLGSLTTNVIGSRPRARVHFLPGGLLCL